MSPPAPVVFGKLPSHGDFVARGLSGPAREAWDRWISDGLARARTDLAETFEAAHESTPPWRFVLGPGRFGPEWRAGALAPSVDSAGRRYMILAAADALAESQALTMGETLAGQMEDLIYRAFESAWTADDLAQALAADLEAVDWTQAGQASEGWWTQGGVRHPPLRLAPEPADALLPLMLTPTMSEAAP